MILNDYGKLWILLLVVAGAILLRALGAIDNTVLMAIIGPVVGYVTGNGKAAVRHEAPSPILVPKYPEEVLADHVDVAEDDDEGR